MRRNESERYDERLLSVSTPQGPALVQLPLREEALPRERFVFWNDNKTRNAKLRKFFEFPLKKKKQKKNAQISFLGASKTLSQL